MADRFGGTDHAEIENAGDARVDLVRKLVSKRIRIQ